MTERRTIEFTVPCVPVAQPRPRAHRVGNHVVMHEAPNLKQQDGTWKQHPVLDFKATVRHAAREAYAGPPLDGPLSIEILFVLPRPQSMRWKTKPMPRAILSTGKDLDNLYKALTDSLNKLVYTDDARIARATIEKVIAAGDEQPRVEVTITELSSEPGRE